MNPSIIVKDESKEAESPQQRVMRKMASNRIIKSRRHSPVCFG
jgi:hypothetical protein